MSTYYRLQKVEAEQVVFTDEQKALADKGQVVTSHDGSLFKVDGEFHVFVHLGHDGKLAKEGDWVVSIGPNEKILVSDEKFEEDYELASNIEREKEEDEKESEEPATPPTVTTPPAESVPALTEPAAPVADTTVISDAPTATSATEQPGGETAVD